MTSFKTIQFRRIRRVILGPMVLLIIFLLSVVILTEYQREKVTTSIALQEKLTNVKNLFEQGQDYHYSLMHGILHFLTKDENLKNYFLSGDRNLLLKSAGPIFERLKKNHKITHFYFLTPQRQVFLRVHQPDRYGDIINRFTALEAQQRAQDAFGLEVGPIGTLTLRLVTPWHQNGRLIGYIELGIELSEVVEMIKKQTDTGLFVSIHKNFLHQKVWETWQKKNHRPDDWNRFEKDVVVQGSDVLSAKIIDAINAYKTTPSVFMKSIEIKDGDITSLMAFYPLKDVQQQSIGDLIILWDITQSQAAFRSSMVLIVTLSIASGIGVFILLFVILGKVQKTINSHRKKVQCSLDEKVVLLKEIHHRVKNNLQVVSSMLSLQAATETDAHAVEVLKEGERRVRVMASVHENLYRSDDLAHVTAQVYLGAIIDDLRQTSAGNISFLLHIEDISFDIDQAIPLGQIVSELISNAQKHAFPKVCPGTVNISLKHLNDGKIQLAVADNGVGMPEDLKLDTNKSLGLKLVNALAQKLNGDIVINSKNGTRVTITFVEETL